MLEPFDRGLVICQDNRRSRHVGPRVVPWREIAASLALPDEPRRATTWRPRKAALLTPPEKKAPDQPRPERAPRKR
jgi:hypothetical protein